MKAKKLLWVLGAAVGLGCLQVSAAGAATFHLAEWATAINGVVDDYLLDPNDTIGGFPYTRNVTVSGAGSYFVGGFFDVEIDQGPNNGFSNEYGATGGVLAAGQSWEIDEPEWVFGDIVSNLSSSTLDNTNSIPAGYLKADGTAGDDVSMALGWDFILTSGQTAVASFSLLSSAPNSGFYLQQIDSDTEATVYLASTLTIRDDNNVVPEPGTLVLLGSGLLGLAAFGRRNRG